MVFNTDNMKISNDFPPNFKNIELKIPSTKEHEAIFCYGDTIYNPYNIQLRPDLIEHEAIHSKRQLANPNTPSDWWTRYLSDNAFRLEEEILAYRHQYQFVKRYVKHHEEVGWFLNKLAESLSSSLYGSLISHQDARKLIRNT